MTSSYMENGERNPASEMPPPLWHIRIYDFVIPAGVIWLVRGPAVLRLGFYVSGKQADNWLIDCITPCLAAYL